MPESIQLRRAATSRDVGEDAVEALGFLEESEDGLPVSLPKVLGLLQEPRHTLQVLIVVEEARQVLETLRDARPVLGKDDLRCDRLGRGRPIT